MRLEDSQAPAQGRHPQCQICPGSSGSGSRTGASGFSAGFGGSLIGAGIGSAGARLVPESCAPDFALNDMVFRCQKRSRGCEVNFPSRQTIGDFLRVSVPPWCKALPSSFDQLYQSANCSISIAGACSLFHTVGAFRPSRSDYRRRTVAENRRRV